MTTVKNETVAKSSERRLELNIDIVKSPRMWISSIVSGGMWGVKYNSIMRTFRYQSGAGSVGGRCHGGCVRRWSNDAKSRSVGRLGVILGENECDCNK